MNFKEKDNEESKIDEDFSNISNPSMILDILNQHSTELLDQMHSQSNNIVDIVGTNIFLTRKKVPIDSIEIEFDINFGIDESDSEIVIAMKRVINRIKASLITLNQLKHEIKKEASYHE